MCKNMATINIKMSSRLPYKFNQGSTQKESSLTFGNSKFYFQFNFVGRILGPRGLTAKQLEQETGCKVMVRGKGSMRDKKKVRLANHN